jgi:hypothetical protein
MLMIDAAHGPPPTHALTLTTRDPDTTSEQVRRGSQNVWLALRRMGRGSVESFARPEFTTGRAARSGGLRRIHLHAAVKAAGLIGFEAEALERIKSAWMARNDGAWRVAFEPLRTPVGALHYLSLHHAKAEQAPPDGWSGRTERVSRGYFFMPSGELRAEARAQIWAERIAWSTGASSEDARFLVDQHAASKADGRQAYAEYAEAMRWTPDPPADLEPAPWFVQLGLDLVDDGIPF